MSFRNNTGPLKGPVLFCPISVRYLCSPTHDTCHRQRNEPLLPSTVLPGRPGDNSSEKVQPPSIDDVTLPAIRYMMSSLRKRHTTHPPGNKKAHTAGNGRPSRYVRHGPRQEATTPGLRAAGAPAPHSARRQPLFFPLRMSLRKTAIRESAAAARDRPGNYIRKERPPVKLTSSRAGFQLTEVKIPNSSPASPSKRQLRPALKWTSCT